MKKALSILFVLVSLVAFAGNPNKGTIVGRVIDAKTNEPIAGAKVFIAELKQEVYTDFDGAFEISPEGNERLSFSVNVVSYQDLALRKLLLETQEVTLKLHGPN